MTRTQEICTQLYNSTSCRCVARCGAPATGSALASSPRPLRVAPCSTHVAHPRAFRGNREADTREMELRYTSARVGHRGVQYILTHSFSQFSSSHAIISPKLTRSQKQYVLPSSPSASASPAPASVSTSATTEAAVVFGIRATGIPGPSSCPVAHSLILLREPFAS